MSKQIRVLTASRRCTIMRAISVDTNQWMVTAAENEILDRASHVILGAFTLRHDDRERAAGAAVCKKRGAWITPVVLTLQSVTYICIYICMLKAHSHLICLRPNFPEFFWSSSVMGRKMKTKGRSRVLVVDILDLRVATPRFLFEFFHRKLSFLRIRFAFIANEVLAAEWA